MGRRSPTDRFMPGTYCFPGGRLDPDDRRMNVAGALAGPVEDRLAKIAPASPGLPRALALAAVRETFEETGLLLGTRAYGPPPDPPALWRAFAEHGVFPDLEPLHFIARAITPPRLPMRYDASFFAVDHSALCGEAPGAVGPGQELVETVWIDLALASFALVLLFLKQQLAHVLRAHAAAEVLAKAVRRAETAL